MAQGIIIIIFIAQGRIDIAPRALALAPESLPRLNSQNFRVSFAPETQAAAVGLAYYTLYYL